PAFAAKLTCVRKFASANEENGHCTVDALAADLPRPVVLKIDVDGGEMDVLGGAEKLLKAKAALLVIETHSRELEEACLKLLKQLHYDCRIVRNAWYRWLVPETRDVPHNRWLVARPRG